MNGKGRTVPNGVTIAELVDELGLRERNIVVERNGEPVERDRFGEVRLAEGDVLEVVRPVQGG